MKDNANPMAKFEERLMDRVRGSASELMSDEELRAALHKAILKVFFEPRPSDSFYGKPKPALIDEIVTGVFVSEMKTHVQAWAEAHREDINGRLLTVLEQDINAMLSRAVLSLFHTPMNHFRMEVQNAISEFMDSQKCSPNP